MAPGTADLLLVFGGSFDPPTRAHVEQPRRVRAACAARKVLYVPAAVSPFKVGRPPTGAAHRLAMLRLALADEPACAIVIDELERARDDRPSYTVDTLETLAARVGPDVRLRLLFGADQLREFHRWHRWRRIVALAEPLVMLRPPDTRAALLAALAPELADQAWASRLVDVPPMAISATDVRRRVARGQAIDHLVVPAVGAYIEHHGLYRDEAADDP